MTLPVEALLTSTRIYGVTHSNNGRLLAYISNASGRPNLWVMNVDGTGARQLIRSEDRQSVARFTHDDRTLVYSQDKGGNEYSDIYAVPVSGGEPRNLTHTDDVSETVDEFSPDRTMLAIAVKQETLPATDLAIMSWPGGAVKLLTHETNPKASWARRRGVRMASLCMPTDRWGSMTPISTGWRWQRERRKSCWSMRASSEWRSRMCRRTEKTLLITSDAKGGYENVALLTVGTKELHWLTETQWSADGVAFTPDGGSAVYLLNADGGCRRGL